MLFLPEVGQRGCKLKTDYLNMSNKFIIRDLGFLLVESSCYISVCIFSYSFSDCWIPRIIMKKGSILPQTFIVTGWYGHYDGTRMPSWRNKYSGCADKHKIWNHVQIELSFFWLLVWMLKLTLTLSGNKVCYCTFRATAACPVALFESLPTKGFIHLRSTTSSGTLLPLRAWKPIDLRESKGLIHNQPLTVHQHVWRIQNKNLSDSIKHFH